MGVDELGGAATLGVVNVGAHGPGRRQEGQGEGGKRGNPPRARSTVTLNGGGEERAGVRGKDDALLGMDRRSEGEVLLEHLERVAEARSIEVRD